MRRRKANRTISSGGPRFGFTRRIKSRLVRHGFVATTLPRQARWAGYVGMFVVGSMLAWLFVGPGSQPGFELATTPTTVATTITTVATTTEPATNPLPPADPELCRVRSVMLLSSSLDSTSGPDELIVSLGLMKVAMEDLRKVDGYPEFTAASEVLRPAVEEAIVMVAANRSGGLDTLATSRLLSDPEVAQAMDVITNLPINCDAS